MNLFLASGNSHKAAEFQALADAGASGVQVLAAAEMPKVVEDAGTFRGNALIKARALSRVLPREWVLADDSGLSVDALGGAPGVESAYFAGPQGDPRANLAQLVRQMAAVPAERRGAHFTCVLCLLGPDGSERIFEGTCAGRLLGAPRGGAGFGYDPLFVPEGHEETFAEMSESQKNRLSHRAIAWARLVAAMPLPGRNA